jgi:hypothetical protein
VSGVGVGCRCRVSVWLSRVPLARHRGFFLSLSSFVVHDDTQHNTLTAAESAMLTERRLSSERQRQLEAVKLQLDAAHESLDKTKAELAAVRLERNDTVSGWRLAWTRRGHWRTLLPQTRLACVPLLLAGNLAVPHARWSGVG